MERKLLLQSIPLLIVLIISFVVYKTYLEETEPKEVESNIHAELIEIKNNKNNLIYDIEYFSKGQKGEEYRIYSKFGELAGDQKNLIKMREVESIIKVENSTPIKILADSAIYDKSNYNTIFSGNVIISYDEHIISSDNADLTFEKNLATIYNNVIYKNLNTKLEADKIDIDILTKNTKISMNDKLKKVRILKLN
tara:strand:+ start:968 stop:1552 length:585 start_codon:yes stop_codon:yes gene_type:complete